MIDMTQFLCRIQCVTADIYRSGFDLDAFMGMKPTNERLFHYIWAHRQLSLPASGCLRYWEKTGHSKESAYYSLYDLYWYYSEDNWDETSVL